MIAIIKSLLDFSFIEFEFSLVYFLLIPPDGIIIETFLRSGKVVATFVT